MSSIQDLIGKIEKSQQKKEGITPAEKREKKEVKKLSPEEMQKKRENFKKSHNCCSSENSGKKCEGKKIGSFSKNNTSEKIENKKTGAKKSGKKKTENKKKRFFVTQVCMSQKSCGNHYGPYVWERLCNDFGQDPECDSFEIQGFRFEKSPCQGACKKAANIRIKEENDTRHTQFSYITPIKASKLIKIIKSGASPDNIKKF